MSRSVDPRAKRLGEQISDGVMETLGHARTADLAAMKRADLTLLRADLDNCKRLLALSGQPVSWKEWRTVQERVQAELDRRPVPTRGGTAS